MIKRAIRLELDSLLKELKMNLENNYKDLAKDALQALHDRLEEYRKTGALKERDYDKYKQIANEYSRNLRDYHH